MNGPHTARDVRSSKIVILVPTHQRPALLSRTLKSIVECNRPVTPVEIRVIENGPECGAKPLVEEIGRTVPWTAVYMHNERSNKSIALNSAIQDLDDEFVIFFDDDIRVSKECLTAYEAAFAGPPGKKFFGGPFGCDYETNPAAWILEYLPKSAKGWDPKDGNSLYAEMPFIGFNWAAKARDIKSIGGFRPEFGPGSTTGGTGQEQFAQEALLARGFQPVFLDKALVHHYVPTERCSPAWCLDRSFRTGISGGFRMRSIGRSKQLLALMRNVLKLIRHFFRMPWRAFFNLQSEKYFEKANRMYFLYGVILGNWRRLRAANTAGGQLS
jgi:glycosyltransferase involved in cell wall biosynthesis